MAIITKGYREGIPIIVSNRARPLLPEGMLYFSPIEFSAKPDVHTTLRYNMAPSSVVAKSS